MNPTVDDTGATSASRLDEIIAFWRNPYREPPPFDLDAFEALERGATPGWWRAGANDRHVVFCHYEQALEGPNGERVLLRFNEHFPFEADAAFACASRAWVGPLISELRRQRAQVIDLHKGALSRLSADLECARQELVALRAAAIPASVLEAMNGIGPSRTAEDCLDDAWAAIEGADARPMLDEAVRVAALALRALELLAKESSR